MITITFEDGSVEKYNKGINISEVIKTVNPSILKKDILAVEVNGDIKDLNYEITNDCKLNFLTFDSIRGKNIYNHTASHIMAQAVKRLYSNVKLVEGFSIKNGFYYDFDLNETLSVEKLQNIENEMKKIIMEDLQIEKFILTKKEAINLMKDRNETYKIELIKDLPDECDVSLYKQGEFVDICKDPHVSSTGKINFIKLIQATGVYWKGNENNKMIQRIYGISFPQKKDIDKYLKKIEEAKKRDHNKLGRDLELFTTVDYIGQGLPILMPKGAKIIQILQRFVEDEEERRGYMITKTPFIAKNDLYKISGHWAHYHDNMFIIGNENDPNSEVFALRPMTCLFQFQVYLTRPRSYRDLPMRLNETSTLFRNEQSGSMHGLIRVRQFTISEGHIICTPEQLKQEFAECVNLANFMLKTLGFYDDVSYRFSKWDPNNKGKYIGTEEQWEEVQNKMRQILDQLNINYIEKNGEAAFYGPKLDIEIQNVYGKEDTLITIQIDFQLAEKFSMQYIDKDSEKKYPYIIHRTSIGCYERTLALLIEKYAGAFPTWLAPIQVKILPLSDEHHKFAIKIEKILKKNHIRVETNFKNEKINYKIREAQLNKIPYMLIVGNKEIENNSVSVRSRKDGNIGSMSLSNFINKISEEIQTKSI